jgi:hypothetical protein
LPDSSVNVYEAFKCHGAASSPPKPFSLAASNIRSLALCAPGAIAALLSAPAVLGSWLQLANNVAKINTSKAGKPRKKRTRFKIEFDTRKQ